MNVKETTTKVKNWCEEHDVLFYIECAAIGGVMGVCFGRSMGKIISNGYANALAQGYNKGRSDAMNLLLKDNAGNPEVVKALAEHSTKYLKEL